MWDAAFTRSVLTLLKAQAVFNLESSVSKDKRVEPECPLSLHLADLFISPPDFFTL